MYKLDIKDKKILHELDVDARQSNTQIGKKVGLSKEVVKYRIDKMMQERIILRFSTIVNFFKLGLQKYKLYLRLRNVTKEKLEEIGDYFYKHKKTEWVVIGSGTWDLIANFIVKNINEFDNEIQNVLNKYSDYIQEKAELTTLYISHAPRGYLSEGKFDYKKNIIFYSSTDKQERIDKIDEEILKILANNARMPITEIAKKINTSERIIQYKIKKMEEKEVILSYKVVLNPKEMGNIFYKAIFYLSNTKKERLDEFMTYCYQIKEGVWPQRLIGSWDAELDMEVSNYERFNEIMMELKQKFSDIIKNTEFFITSKEFKLDFYPGCYSQFK
ncbi:MAG: Lrp/AsnC family transcriptional regulator [Candidatus Nanoarchaeia archaeon]|nr:Lrp/AsnC family transcriptional regulator [Candidatus Nanoarchaeia archaeon]MDD5588079.1 Lrp/AsnC family transcriptional regulator [Candidatus Nanoarchaeia archaeon]